MRATSSASRPSGPAPTKDGQAPHLNVIVLMRGLLLHAFTRVYFEGEAGQRSRSGAASVPADRRRTLLAVREADRGGSPVYRFDIRMQGPDETVFFDVEPRTCCGYSSLPICMT